MISIILNQSYHNEKRMNFEVMMQSDKRREKYSIIEIGLWNTENNE